MRSPRVRFACRASTVRSAITSASHAATLANTDTTSRPDAVDVSMAGSSTMSDALASANHARRSAKSGRLRAKRSNLAAIMPSACSGGDCF